MILSITWFADTWGRPSSGSFGMLAWELLTREVPFSDITFMHLIREAVVAGKRPAIPPDTPPLVRGGYPWRRNLANLGDSTEHH